MRNWYVRLGAVLCLSMGLWGCSDDPKPTPQEQNNDPGDAGPDADDPNNDAPDVDEPDVDEDEPDVPRPVPTNDQEAVLFVPETESWELPGLQDEVHVVRTEMNIPHIFAKNREDLATVLGFVVARDRYFVMDLQRRMPQGNLSALLGDLALEIDMESRQTGMTHVTELVDAGLRPEDRAFMEAYARGINEYIRRVEAGELPPPSEFQAISGLFGADKPSDLMEPFTVRDLSAMVTVIMYQTNFETGDIGRRERYDALPGLFEGDPHRELRMEGALNDIWDNLQLPFDVTSVPDWSGSIGSGSRVGPAGPMQLQVEGLPKLDKGLLGRASARLERLKNRLGRREAENFGSNTWAVSGAHSANGEALVAGDGHLPLYVPSLMYQIGMNTTVFGGGDIHQAGLLITSLPVLAVGTNGKVAWSQVNPVADITDWYAEQVVLGPDGLPEATVLGDGQRPMRAIEESHVVANIDFLDSVGRTETWTRYETFDGRPIYDLEGRRLADDEEPGEGEAVVVLPGARIVPGDQDGDGVVSALSFDYTAFDTTGYVAALVDFSRAQTVADYQEATKGLIGNMLYSAVADQDGDILFTSYQGVPCRGYLERGEDGRWVPGADPTMVIDGTRYTGFTIPSGPDGKVDESQADDPYRCAVPFDATPQVISPEQGFVVNANNQPAPLHTDRRLDDDPIYIGGPWASVRADSIAGELQKAVDEGTADEAKMAEIQGHTRSRLGELFAPALVQALVRAEEFNSIDRLLLPHEQRLVDLYNARTERFEEVRQRLEGWIDRGYGTSAGVDTFYRTHTPQEVEDSVATMIFNAWLPRAIEGTFGDERMEPAWRFSRSRMAFHALNRFLRGRGQDNPGALASWNPETGESIFFDVRDTEELETSDEILVAALADALAFLEGPTEGGDSGGFNTQDMAQWRWGMRHQVRFESLLADFLPPGSSFSFLTDLFSITTRTLSLAQGLDPMDPRRRLKWFPRPGDNFSVDAASPGFSGTRFTYGSGPVMRMVIALKDGRVTGRNIVPGGQSGLYTSDFFSDQAALWLGNQTVPLRYHPEDIYAGAVGREVYK